MCVCVWMVLVSIIFINFECVCEGLVGIDGVLGDEVCFVYIRGIFLFYFVLMYRNGIRWKWVFDVDYKNLIFVGNDRGFW